ncbi:LysR family transcriptional regulator substrate-binding protein [Spelaeicoccus albus]|uniref:LysR substrate-binding domain-containing protein n=1 Tax=Spelaeicoccus albus TaxID=1280376 RepID=A0A7Z0AAM4_9MICO|nr:LysR family transcriptional regulator substrate-binding protein [Spelaeicoccus albus]NYI66691.1 hypothetical protein [Spelaeicoccus albus]
MEGTAENAAPRSLTVAYVEGVTPGKWFGRWKSRMPGVALSSWQTDAAGQLTPLREGEADMSFVRLPIDDAGLHVIPLYMEAAVVVMGRDHELTICGDVTQAELDDENVLRADEHGFKLLIELVATGVGVAVVPMSIARLYARKDVVYRPIPDVAGTRIALVWPKEPEAAARDSATDDTAGMKRAELLEEFIGIVRGRTANSSRQPSTRQQQKREQKQRGGQDSGPRGSKKSGKRWGPAGRRPRGRPPRRH